MQRRAVVWTLSPECTFSPVSISWLFCESESLRSLVKTDCWAPHADSVVLGWGLRICSSENKFLRDAGAVGSGTTLKASALNSAASVGSFVPTFMSIRKCIGSRLLHLKNVEGSSSRLLCLVGSSWPQIHSSADKGVGDFYSSQASPWVGFSAPSC